MGPADFADAFQRIAYARQRISADAARSEMELARVEDWAERVRYAVLRSGLFRGVVFRPGDNDRGLIHACPRASFVEYLRLLGYPDDTEYETLRVCDDQMQPLGRLIFDPEDPDADGMQRVRLEPHRREHPDLGPAAAALGATIAAPEEGPPPARPCRFPHNVDWALLRAQMEWLEWAGREPSRLVGEQADAMGDGLLNLLGALKDYAVDVCHIDEELVFGPREEVDVPDTVSS